MVSLTGIHTPLSILYFNFPPAPVANPVSAQSLALSLVKAGAAGFVLSTRSTPSQIH